MRIAIGTIRLNTNRFTRRGSVVEPPIDRERIDGQNLIEIYTGTSTVMGGALAAAARIRARVLPAFAVLPHAVPALDRESAEALADEIADSIQHSAPDPDALLIELDGTLASECGASVDGSLLRAIRGRYPATPTVVVLQPYGNVDPRLFDLCDGMLDAGFGDPTIAHRRGAEAIDLLTRLVGSRGVNHAFRTIPAIVSLPSSIGGSDSARRLAARARDLRARSGALAISVFGGFAYADTPHARLSVSASIDGDAQIAEAIVDEIADLAGSMRTSLYPEGRNVEEAVHVAMDSHAGPVVLSDLGDDPMFGATGDGTTILWALLDLGANDAAIGPIVDADAVDECVRSGVGKRITLSVGGRLDTRAGYPIELSGTVKRISDGCFTTSGPVWTNVRQAIGRAVVAEAEARHNGKIEIVLTERPPLFSDPALFTHLGIDVRKKELVAVKGNGLHRPAFASIGATFVDVTTPGITTPDLRFFAFERLTRPVFPLDEP